MSTAIEETSAPVLTVADVVGRVRHRPRSFLIPIVLGLVASVAYVLLAPKSYVAVASIQVQPVVADQFSSVNLSNVLNMATEAQVAQSTSVTDLAAKALGTEADQVRAGLAVDSPQDTQVLNVRFTATKGADAARGAQTVAEKYLEFRAASTKKDAERRIVDLDTQIAANQSKLAGKPGAQTGALQGDLQALLASRRQWQAIASASVGRILTSASEPSAPSSPAAKKDIPLGVATGLIIGLALAVLLPTPERVRIAAGVRPVTPRRARDTRGKPSEFDRMLATAQRTEVEQAPAPSPSGPVTVPLDVAPGTRGALPGAPHGAPRMSMNGPHGGVNGGNGADPRRVDAGGVARNGAGANGSGRPATTTGPARGSSPKR